MAVLGRAAGNSLTQPQPMIAVEQVVLDASVGIADGWSVAHYRKH